MSENFPLAGVIGSPIAHSLSPRLHRFWLQQLGIRGDYVPLAVPREVFSQVLQGLRRAGFAGLNITVPHKQAAFSACDVLDDAARQTGAVNLLLFEDQCLTGRNTDIFGLRNALVQELGAAALQGSRSAILGAGGAARAAAVVMDQLGAAEVYILNRTENRAKVLVAELQPNVRCRLSARPLNTWPEIAPRLALLVNATSAGMRGAAPLNISLDALPLSAAVCDLVYNPLETKLLSDAMRRGHKAVDGLWMLIHQAAPAFEAFYGVAPSVSPELRIELERALGRHA